MCEIRQGLHREGLHDPAVVIQIIGQVPNGKSTVVGGELEARESTERRAW